MGLAGKHSVLRGKPHRLAQNFIVFPYPFRLVSPVNAQVQAGKAPGTHTPQTGGEAMGRRLEQSTLDILQAALFYGFKFQEDSFPGGRC